MDKKGLANENDRMKHYKGQPRTGFSPLSYEEIGSMQAMRSHNADEMLFAEPESDFITGRMAGDCAEAGVYTPQVHHYRQFLTTGPFLMPRSGRLMMVVENPYMQSVCAEVQIFDLHRGRREPLRACGCMFRKMIKLAARQTGTVSFENGIPEGFLLEACVRTDGFVVPMLELEAMNGSVQMLYKSVEFLSLDVYEPHHC